MHSTRHPERRAPPVSQQRMELKSDAKNQAVFFAAGEGGGAREDQGEDACLRPAAARLAAAFDGTAFGDPRSLPNVMQAPLSLRSCARTPRSSKAPWQRPPIPGPHTWKGRSKRGAKRPARASDRMRRRPAHRASSRVRFQVPAPFADGNDLVVKGQFSCETPSPPVRAPLAAAPFIRADAAQVTSAVVKRPGAITSHRCRAHLCADTVRPALGCVMPAVVSIASLDAPNSVSLAFVSVDVTSAKSKDAAAKKTASGASSKVHSRRFCVE